MKLEQKVLKAILLLRKNGNTYQTKEEQIAEQFEWLRNPSCHYTEADIEDWIDFLKLELTKTEEQKETDAIAFYSDDNWCEPNEYYCPSCTAHDYSPSNPWDAPGMSVRDFI